ncbi:MAG: VOC family protein [Leptospira sp.]|nr:VOC family protein [Leptospira sp.]
MNKSNAIGWFDIYVENLDRATKFYEGVFQIKLTKMGDPTGETKMMSFPAEMSVYGAAGALVKSDYAKPGSGGTMLYFNSEDCNSEESRIVKFGGKVIRNKFSIGEYGWVSICEDSEGNSIGISSMK